MDEIFQNFPIEKISPNNPFFPEELKKISSSPKELFFRGKLPKNQKKFAIVGTRQASEYGKEISFSIANDLSQNGFCVVSGMAKGIDTWAAKGALKTSQKKIPCPTVAILGTGLDEKNIYPQENIRLAREILEKNGCLISEYAPNTRGTSFTFPQRNRIIAAMSLGILVVECKLKSGALITAQYAKKYKRPVFAVPGNIHSQNSQGCHWLIKQGALLAENAADILKALDLPFKNFQKSIFENPNQKKIAEILKKGALPLDKIIELVKMPSQEVSSLITIMEIEDKIKNLGENVYSLNS